MCLAVIGLACRTSVSLAHRLKSMFLATLSLSNDSASILSSSVALLIPLYGPLVVFFCLFFFFDFFFFFFFFFFLLKRVLQKHVVYSLQSGDTFTLLVDEYPLTVHIRNVSVHNGRESMLADAEHSAAAGRAVAEALQRPLDPPGGAKAKPSQPDRSKRECSYGHRCAISSESHRLEFYHPPASAVAEYPIPTTASSAVTTNTAAASSTAAGSSGHATGKRTRSPPPGLHGTKRPASSDATTASNAAVTDGDAPHGVKRSAQAARASVSHGSDSDTPNAAPLNESSEMAVPSLLSARPLSSQISSPIKRTRVEQGKSDIRSQGSAGARTLALPFLCTARRSVRANLPASNAARALAASGRVFLRRHIDDTECKLVLVAANDCDALKVFEALDEPIGDSWQYQIVRVADQNAVAHALVHLLSEHQLPARFICNEATWRLHAGGAPINRAVFDAAGEEFDQDVRKRLPGPAEVGRVYSTPLDAISPLRRTESVWGVLHAVVPVVDPEAPDCVSIEQGTGILRELYDEVFTAFEQSLFSEASKTPSAPMASAAVAAIVSKQAEKVASSSSSKNNGNNKNTNSATTAAAATASSSGNNAASTTKTKV
jgi:hypothetical protein